MPQFDEQFYRDFFMMPSCRSKGEKVIDPRDELLVDLYMLCAALRELAHVVGKNVPQEIK